MALSIATFTNAAVCAGVASCEGDLPTTQRPPPRTSTASPRATWVDRRRKIDRVAERTGPLVGSIGVLSHRRLSSHYNCRGRKFSLLSTTDREATLTRLPCALQESLKNQSFRGPRASKIAPEQNWSNPAYAGQPAFFFAFEGSATLTR